MDEAAADQVCTGTVLYSLYCTVCTYPNLDLALENTAAFALPSSFACGTGGPSRCSGLLLSASADVRSFFF